MKSICKKVLAPVLLTIILIISCLCGACSAKKGDANSKITEFYNLVSESKKLLDDIADDYYTYWYEAIYKNKYLGDINIALTIAESANTTKINTVKSNDGLIKTAYQSAKSEKYEAILREVMTTYSDYYEFVINISGSFNSYSSGKETKKKALATALKSLSFEI